MGCRRPRDARAAAVGTCAPTRLELALQLVGDSSHSGEVELGAELERHAHHVEFAPSQARELIVLCAGALGDGLRGRDR